MLKRARGLGLGAALVALIGWSGVTPLAAGGCQSTCSTASDCGSGNYCSAADGACLAAQVVGFCKSVPATCPIAVDPVCGCDGKQYDNDCLAAKARVSVSVKGPCMKSACGGQTSVACADASTYCHFDDGTCSTANATGSCQTVPASCDDLPLIVCGCDGKTYPSRCEAAHAGTSVFAVGGCPCGGASNVGCEVGKYCKLATGDCSKSNPLGACTDVPTMCTSASNPVCGCDGKTYDSECASDTARVSVAATGRCACGTGTSCESTEYCTYAKLGDCLTPSTMGACAPRPATACSGPGPVCGCDGTNYANACEAAKAGTDISSTLACGAVAADGG